MPRVTFRFFLPPLIFQCVVMATIYFAREPSQMCGPSLGIMLFLIYQPLCALWIAFDLFTGFWQRKYWLRALANGAGYGIVWLLMHFC